MKLGKTDIENMSIVATKVFENLNSTFPEKSNYEDIELLVEIYDTLLDQCVERELHPNYINELEKQLELLVELESFLAQVQLEILLESKSYSSANSYVYTKNKLMSILNKLKNYMNK